MAQSVYDADMNCRTCTGTCIPCLGPPTSLPSGERSSLRESRTASETANQSPHCRSPTAVRILRDDVAAWQPKKSSGSRNCATTTITMRSIARSIQPVYVPLLRSKQATRIRLSNATPAPAWARPFHATAGLRVVDLAYSFHDNKGSAKGDPIVIIHGLFGSKKNNRSVSKYVALPA
jgi:hypothetical protein